MISATAIAPGQPAYAAQGLTLIELLIAMALGLIVTLAATALLLSSKSGYITVDENARIEESGRYAIETVTRALRQAGYVDWSRTEGPYRAKEKMSPNIIGLDDRALEGASQNMSAPIRPGINGSDVLGIRFFGAGAPDKPDGTILDCAGFPIAEPANPEAAEKDTDGLGRGWSIFYVAENAGGEPELYCKFRRNNQWTSAALVRGVESLQILYGVDMENTGVASHFKTATQLRELDTAMGVTGSEMNMRSWWKNVVSVRVAFLIRSEHDMAMPVENTTYHLFGPDYSAAAGTQDHPSFTNTDFPAHTHQRLRRVFETTVNLRNSTPHRIE